MKPARRRVDGILLLHKPPGISSNAALQTVKRRFAAAKAGHTGNLDVPAEGLLPICLGEATKFGTFLLDADKRYIADVRLGVTTSTGDAAGEITGRHPVDDLDETRLAAAADRFIGEIDQQPPMHSAVKVGGQRLYKLAYRGEEVERPTRRIRVFHLGVERLAADRLRLTVHCSKGTYIRTLAADLGEALACGAHVERLLRTQVGRFRLEEAHTLASLEATASAGMPALDALLVAMDAALADTPRLDLSLSNADKLRRGQTVPAPSPTTSGLVRLYGGQAQFIGIGEIRSDGQVAPRRLIRTET